MDSDLHPATFDSDDHPDNPPPLLTSPIARLPTELLSDIFLALLEAYEHPDVDMATIDATRATILAVCVHWRTIALDHRALWTGFAFVVTSKKLHRWGEYMVWVTTWVGRRSPNADLRILVRLNTRTADAVQEMATLSAFLEDGLYRQTRSLEINDGVDPQFAEPLYPLRGGAMPHLASIEVSGYYASILFFRIFSGNAHTPNAINAPLLSEIILHYGHLLSRNFESVLSSFSALERLQVRLCSPKRGPDRKSIILPHLKLLNVDHPEAIPLHVVHAPELVELRLTYGFWSMGDSYTAPIYGWDWVDESLRNSGHPDPFPQLRTVRMAAPPIRSSSSAIGFYESVGTLIKTRPQIRALWYKADDINPETTFNSFESVSYLLGQVHHLEELHISLSASLGLLDESSVWIHGFLDLWPAMRDLLARSETLKLWWILEAPEPQTDVERMCSELSSEFPSRFIATLAQPTPAGLWSLP